MGGNTGLAIGRIVELARRAGRERARRLPAYPLDPGAEFGETPEGYRAAFLGGARPPWPGPRAAPGLVARWTALRRSAATGTIAPRAEVEHRHLSHSPCFSNNGAAGFGGSRWQGSRNWSGAILTARDGERFSAVSGRWRVPDARPSATAAPPIEGPTPDVPLSRRCSVWVGLDGHSRMAGSLPQIGTTTAECFQDGRRWVSTYAWAQWWVRGEQYGEMAFEDFRLSPGDEVTCWLALHAEDRVVLCIRNETTGQEDGALWHSGPPKDELARQAHATPAPVPGLAAVWVVERPTVMGREELYPLPDVGAVTFADCIAAIRAPGQPFHEAADLRALDGRRLVRMHDRRTGPCRAPRIALPDRPGADRTLLTVRCRV
ncbi:G1 family glutamic endopeptidase [Falsiroseomonas sp. CW058]|uniref:G1 family glutamic endopeptidase n=1 Tax=Falsiroseomonas sp. CW058 TaxID=3388664 RepID=UPI003D312A8D